MIKPSDLLSQQGAWCQGVLSRNRAGYFTAPDSADAVSWCAMGAIARTAVDDAHMEEMELRLKTHIHEQWGSVPKWNDHFSRTQTEVVEAFKEIGL